MPKKTSSSKQSKAPAKRGAFITFEGIDGSGKTTQLELTRDWLKAQGIEPLCLREPGSVGLAEGIRQLLLDKNQKIDPYPELLLYLAARGQLTHEVIAPALSANRIVLCDRFHDSTVAYQGFGRKLDRKLIAELYKKLVGSATPDMTLFYDIDWKSSLTRRKASADRLEKESEQFFKAVRRGFTAIAKKEPRRVKTIDSSEAPDIIFAQTRAFVSKLLSKRGWKIIE